jgi:hypothetical protein
MIDSYFQFQPTKPFGNWEITPEGALFAKERFLNLVKEALASKHNVSWGLLPKALANDRGLNVHFETGVEAFPHMSQMSRILDFDISK